MGGIAAERFRNEKKEQVVRWSYAATVSKGNEPVR
jgi:hypothetical protein